MLSAATFRFGLSITAAIFSVSFASLCAEAHENEESRVAIALESPSTIQAGASSVRFQLIDTQLNRSVTPADLNVTHEKKLHFMVYDPSLQKFQHVHPEFDGRIWNASLDFQVDGLYFAWAQGELQNGGEEFSSLTRIEIAGGEPALPPPALSDIRSGALDGSVATLSAEPLKAGQMAMLMLNFTREDGSPAEITPYLGAFAHVIATPEEGDTLLHVHPMDGSQPNEGMLHVVFPAAGAYRIWVQFIDAGVLKTIALSVVVGK